MHCWQISMKLMYIYTGLNGKAIMIGNWLASRRREEDTFSLSNNIEGIDLHKWNVVIPIPFECCYRTTHPLEFLVDDNGSMRAWTPIELLCMIIIGGFSWQTDWWIFLLRPSVVLLGLATLYGGCLGSATEEGSGKQLNAWGSRLAGGIYFMYPPFCLIACRLRTQDFRIGLPALRGWSERIGNAVNWNILLAAGITCQEV